MNIGILGLGSLGSLMAYHWQDHSLFSLPRTAQSRLKVKVNNQGDLWQAELAGWQGEPLDWLVVCTKAADTLSALQQWQSFLPQVNNILLLQNGMGQQQQTADWLTQQQLNAPLWVAMCTEGAYRDNDTVVYAGIGKTLIGLWPENKVSTNTQANNLLPHTELTQNIKQHLLSKLAINAVINPLTAYYRCKNGELVNTPILKQQLIALSEEVGGLYQALHWPLNKPLPELCQQVALATADNTSSTLQDVLANRPTELPFISGYLLEQAQAIAYDLPLTQKLYNALK